MDDFIVIGAGIVGLATAWQLRQRAPQARITVIEKESAVAQHQSGHNSGVIHAGVYYPPDSLKARYCREGVETTLAFCREQGVPAQQCGKLIVAVDAAEEPRLDALHQRATGNGLKVDWLDAAALREREPEVRGVAAVYVPTTGIADYPALCRRLAQRLLEHDVRIELNAPVHAIRESGAEVSVLSAAGSFPARHLLVCAGLQADRLARMAGLCADHAVVPFRGDYYRLPAARSNLVRTLIYPVPDPALPFLGVHLTLDTAGGLTLGPSAMLALARESYHKAAFDLRDAAAAATFPGTWKLLARFARAGLNEVAMALSRQRYLAAARRYCPALEAGDLAQHECGIRAQLVSRGGDMVHDFLLERTARTIHVLNAPSPAATSAFPIGAALAEQALAR